MINILKYNKRIKRRGKKEEKERGREKREGERGKGRKRGRARERGRVIHINKRNGLDLNGHILKV